MENITVENCNRLCHELGHNADPLKPVRLEQAMAWKVIYNLCCQIGMPPIEGDEGWSGLQKVVNFITENAKKP